MMLRWKITMNPISHHRHGWLSPAKTSTAGTMKLTVVRRRGHDFRYPGRAQVVHRVAIEPALEPVERLAAAARCCFIITATT